MSAFRCHLLLFSSCLLGAPLVCAAQGLPDAPTVAQLQSQEPPTPSTHVPVPHVRPDSAAAVEARKWSDVVNPGEKIPALSVRDKLLFPVHEEFRWTTLVPILYDAEYGVLTNSDPKYGTNGKAWGQRVGAAALRQATTRAFSDGFFPVIFHEDPRYYRQAYGSYPSRTEHAIRRIFIAQSDSGQRMFNYADILGRAVGAELTQTYYPQRSRDAEVVVSTWGLSLVALGGGNLFEEFWPDLKHKLFHGPR